MDVKTVQKAKHHLKQLRKELIAGSLSPSHTTIYRYIILNKYLLIYAYITHIYSVHKSDCEPGKYTKLPGSLECLTCAVGEYNDLYGYSSYYTSTHHYLIS